MQETCVFLSHITIYGGLTSNPRSILILGNIIFRLFPELSLVGIDQPILPAFAKAVKDEGPDQVIDHGKERRADLGRLVPSSPRRPLPLRTRLLLRVRRSPRHVGHDAAVRARS